MTHASLFSGIGGFDLAAEWAGWTNLFNCEIDPFCRRVLKHHFPNAKQYTDIRETDFTVWRDRIDVLTGGFPCFPANTKVLTTHGYKEIRHITLTDQVLTHRGRFMPVNALMHRIASDVISVKAQGIPHPIITTPNHPFWVKKKVFPRARNYYARYASPEWVAAERISQGDLIAYRCIEGSERYKTPAFWYLVGRYLGDGWIQDGKRTSKIPQGKRGSRVTSKNWKVIICCKKSEKEQVERSIMEAGYRYTISEDRTTYKFIISSKELTCFLYSFGRYSYGKKLSGACFSLIDDYKKALFQGWLDADGYIDGNGAYKVTTVSEELVFGMAQIARDCFRTPVSISKKSVERECFIEGRRVNERPQYCLTVSNCTRYGYYENGFVWCLVKNVHPLNESMEVFNIGVQQDETYTANGITVHNCQPFSVAGKRKGTDDPRHLWPEMLRAIREIRPRWVVGENVRGILSWNGGMVFEQVCADLETAGYEVQPFVLPACSVGAPHRRDRVWFIAHAVGSRTGRESREIGNQVRGTGENRSENIRQVHRAVGADRAKPAGHDVADSADARVKTVRERTEGVLPHVAASDANGHRCRKRTNQQVDICECSRKAYNCLGCQNGITSDPDGERRPKHHAPSESGEANERDCASGYEIPNWDGFPTQSPVCSGDDGLPAGLDGITVPRWRAESIKAYGNAIVPQVAYKIFRTINETEK